MRLCLFFVLLAACGPAPSPTPVPRAPGPDQTVVGFDRAWVHFGAENRREVDAPAALPPSDQTFSRITGRFRLDCPEVAGGCDHWDRYGTFGVVVDGDDGPVFVELDRFVTAYRTSFGWESDLTSLRPLLTGDVTLRVFIDTWVSEGHSDGAGWLFTAELDFEGGAPPSPEVTDVVPVWPHGSYNAGDPAAVTALFAGVPLDLPTRDWSLRAFITGHGFGGAANCAEFCARDHTFTVDDEALTRTIWRDDCESTATDGPQLGTWQYDRAGWCPGAAVAPWEAPLQTPGGAVSASYDLEPWVWPGDGGQPYYYMSALLLGAG